MNLFLCHSAKKNFSDSILSDEMDQILPQSSFLNAGDCQEDQKLLQPHYGLPQTVFTQPMRRPRLTPYWSSTILHHSADERRWTGRKSMLLTSATSSGLSDTPA